jgi:outer membrane protein OmpA-like peptidoglycan-associated protein
MFRLIIGILSCLILLGARLSAQNTNYSVSKSPLSSDIYDEFCPVFYGNGIVFCSNRNSNSLSDYSNVNNTGTFNIFFIDTVSRITWKKAKLLSRSLSTKFNDGPATFNSTGDTVFFSRNQKLEGRLNKISKTRNNLGVFMAVKDGKNWKGIKELRYNNEWYNITMPCLSPDGKRLFFASDMPDGYGGSDIYYCKWEDGYWDRPVNLGPVINTEGNEAYPFIDQSGDLFFASDGHPGLGGKDIFFSKSTASGWLDPVAINEPVNSEYDDFGIITDSLMRMGYFSSNRDNTIDIYSYKTLYPQILYSEEQRINHKCFVFSDDGLTEIDTLRFEFEWDFGDENRKRGKVVEHCFPGPGKYHITETIIESLTEQQFFTKMSYDLLLKDIEQPYISGPEKYISNFAVEFNASQSNLPGYKIVEYFWDFGDGEKATGEVVRHTYFKPGEYRVKLGLTAADSTTGIISKRGVSRTVYIFNDSIKLNSADIARPDLSNGIVEVDNYDHAIKMQVYSAASSLEKGAVFQVEILSSKEKLDMNSSVFNTVPGQYSVREVYDQESGNYSYIIDEQLDLMATFNAYAEAFASGYREAKAKIVEVKDPAIKELNNLKKLFGASTDSYFDANNLLTSTAYLFLDNIVRLMNKYPGTRLKIGVHTDTNRSFKSKLRESEIYALTILDYLISRGVSGERLSCRGYGGSKPIAPNFLESGRKLNRRLEVTITRD